MRSVCEENGCQYAKDATLNRYTCVIASPTYYDCKSLCTYGPVCVNNLSAELDGEYIFDGLANRNGRAPSWKKESSSATYFLYWYVQYFRITEDADKKSG